MTATQQDHHSPSACFMHCHNSPGEHACPVQVQSAQSGGSSKFLQGVCIVAILVLFPCESRAHTNGQHDGAAIMI